MKKLCFIMAVFLLCFCLSCETEGGTGGIQYSKEDYQLQLGTFAGLDEDTEWQILQDYFKELKKSGKNSGLTINDVWVENYFGSYCPLYLIPNEISDPYDFLRDKKNHTAVALMMGISGIDYGTEQRDVLINYSGNRNAVVRYHDTNTIVLWDQGNFYDLEAAIEASLLWVVHFRNIVNRQNGLDFETDAIIREAIGKSIMTGWDPEDYEFMTINYLGTYNGYTAFSLIEGYLTDIFEKTIGGVLFSFPSRPVYLRAWKEGVLYELDYLYQQQLITREDLVEMAYFHNARLED